MPLSANPLSRNLKPNWKTTQNGSPSLPPLTELKGRTTNLIVFNILGILLGCPCALLVLMMLLGQAMSAQAMGERPTSAWAIPGMMTYAIPP